MKYKADWIDSTVERPEEDGEYLVYWGEARIGDHKIAGVECHQVAYYRKESGKFVDPDGEKKWRDPDYWTQLPEPPNKIERE